MGNLFFAWLRRSVTNAIVGGTADALQILDIGCPEMPVLTFQIRAQLPAPKDEPKAATNGRKVRV